MSTSAVITEALTLVLVLVLDLARLTLHGVSCAMPEIAIREFNPEMTDDTAEVLARAFVTNPLNVAAFGVDQVSERSTLPPGPNRDRSHCPRSRRRPTLNDALLRGSRPDRDLRLPGDGSP